MEIGQLLQSVTDEMLEGLQIISREWRYLYVNETVARQGKSTKEKLLGRTMMECYPGIENTPFFEQAKKAMDQRLNIRMENEFTYPDGTTGWFQLYIHPVSEGIMILSADITSRKISEGMLRQKIDELDAMVNFAVGGDIQIAEMKRAIGKLKHLAPELGSSAEPY